MKIAIFGTRGIPNHYGGFEQFAEYLSLELVARGHDITVFNSHNHPYQGKDWKGVKIHHAYDPEKQIGTVGQFIYDLNCIFAIRKGDFDIVLQLGYTSSSVWSRLLPKRKTKIVTNMDGLEWKRSKYSKKVQRFLKFAEKLAVKHSHHLISDSIGIQEYLLQTYGVSSTYIPYGATLIETFDDSRLLASFQLTAKKYDLIIARMEPENNIEMILDGFAVANTDRTLLIIGNVGNAFGRHLVQKFSAFPKIQFLGAIYDQSLLNQLRSNAFLYFHGHSVGGTNPSLLEAMACSSLICAHDNIFNRSVLQDDAYYFRKAEDITALIEDDSLEDQATKIEHNREKISTLYTWTGIADQYEDLFKKALA